MFQKLLEQAIKDSQPQKSGLKNRENPETRT